MMPALVAIVTWIAAGYRAPKSQALAMILSVVGFIVLLLADPGNLNLKGNVPFKY